MNKEREFPFTQQDFQYLKTVANQHTGIVVDDDKFDMFYSRLARRLRKLSLSSFHEYCELIKAGHSNNEVLELVNCITTNLTAFFRENHHFEFLGNVALPEAIKKNRAHRKIRIWSAGCSTGEEPYSLAMTLLESMPDIQQWDVQILATDIDSNVLQKAADGIYTMESVKDFSPARLKRFFMRGKGSHEDKVRVKEEVKKLIKFGKFNLIEDWTMPEPFDIIFCRNVIIYFDKKTKQKLVSRYANTVADGGYLCIGHSESLFRISDSFELVGQTIYRKPRV